MRLNIIIVILWFFTLLISAQNNNTNTLKGEEYFTNSEYKSAIESFLNAIKNNEDNYEHLYHRIGDCYLNLENFNEALKWYKKENKVTGSIYTGMLTSFYRIGWDLYNKGKTKEAFEIFEEGALYGLDFPSELIFEKEGWFFITQANYDYVYYNKNNIQRISKGKIKVWLKWYWDEKSMNEGDLKKIYDYGNNSAATNRRINEIMEERENISYTLTFEEYDFNKNRTRFLETIKYDKKGNVVKSISWDSSGENSWMNVVPGSVGEIIFNTLKNKYNK